MKIVEKYLPKQLSAEEVKQVVDDTIKQLGASGMKDFGKVMGAAMGQLKVQADGNIVNQTVKAELNK